MSFRFISGDDQGNIYAVTEHGDLLYYRDKARNGTESWAHGGVGQRIGTGWGDFVEVFCGDDGVIYAVKENGDLLYYRDEARNGTAAWAFGGVGQKIGSGATVFALRSKSAGSRRSAASFHGSMLDDAPLDNEYSA